MALLDAATEHRDVALAMIARLFPAALRHVGNDRYGLDSKGPWLRERRVAHEDVLRYYLERVAGTGLRASWNAERAVQFLTDTQQLDAFMRSLEPTEWKDVIGALEAYEEEFPAEAAEPATIVLLNLLFDLPELPRGFFEFDSRTTVKRVVLRLLRRLQTPRAIEEAVRSVLPAISTFSGKITLLNLIGHEENIGHELVNLDASMELELKLRNEVRSATPEVLAAEPNLFRLLIWTRKTAAPSEPPLDLPMESALGNAVLKGAASDIRSQTLGARVLRVENVLRWDLLVNLVGSEDAIREIVDTYRTQDGDETLAEIIGLAEKYLGGWRPRDL